MDSVYYLGGENTVVFVTNIFLLHKSIRKVNNAMLQDI